MRQDEVASILEHFDSAAGGKDKGLISLIQFRAALRAIYNEEILDEQAVLGAWASSVATSTGRSDARVAELDAGLFLAWHAEDKTGARLVTALARDSPEPEVVEPEPDVAQVLETALAPRDFSPGPEVRRVSSEDMLRQLVRKHGASPRELAGVKKAFEECDTNNSRSLDYAEFRAMVFSQVGAELGEGYVRTLWGQIKADSCGEVDFYNFATWYLGGGDAP